MSSNGRSDPAAQRTCGNCRHWFKIPQDPMNLDPKSIRGQCREGPPHMTLVALPGPNGQPVLHPFADYPALPPTYAACSKFLTLTINGD